MKVSPVSFAIKNSVKINNNTQNYSNSGLKLNQENDVFISSKKIQPQSFMGLFSTNPIFSSKQVSNDENTNDINEVYQILESTISQIEKQSKTDVKKIRSFISLGQKQDFKGYIRVKNLTKDGKDGLLKFNDFDESNIPSRIDISYADNPFNVVQTYNFDDMCHITKTYVDEQGIKSRTVSQGGKPWQAIQYSQDDDLYQEITFYPNGLRTIVLGFGEEDGKKESKLFFTFDKKNSQKCHYFEISDDMEEFEHYTYNSKINKWELKETLPAKEAQEAFSKTIFSLI